MSIVPPSSAPPLASIVCSTSMSCAAVRSTSPPPAC
jgi:hypothetical protein